MSLKTKGFRTSRLEQPMPDNKGFFKDCILLKQTSRQNRGARDILATRPESTTYLIQPVTHHSGFNTFEQTIPTTDQRRRINNPSAAIHTFSPFGRNAGRHSTQLVNNEKAGYIPPPSHTAALTIQDDKPMRNKPTHRSSTKENFWNLSGNSRKHTRLQVEPEAVL